MKAVFITEPEKVEIREIALPILKEGEALLKVRYCGICGADVASYLGNQPFTTYPRIPGHEFSAEIVTVPPNERGLNPGDIVTCNPYFNCGKCYSCRRGFVNCCTDNQTMGVQRDGAFCEYVAMPVERILPGMGLSDKELALIEPFSIAYHAVSRCRVNPSDRVLVVGAGPIGLFALASAKLRGASVYVSDVLDGRLEKALLLGADGVINPKKQDINAWRDQITDGHGFDICVEACGLPDTFLTCLDQAAFAANILLIGNGKKHTDFMHSIILKKELNIYGSRNSYSRDFEMLISLAAEKKFDVMQLVTNEYPMERAEKAFEALAHNDGTLVKVLLKISE